MSDFGFKFEDRLVELDKLIENKQFSEANELLQQLVLVERVQTGDINLKDVSTQNPTTFSKNTVMTMEMEFVLATIKNTKELSGADAMAVLKNVLISE